MDRGATRRQIIDTKRVTSKQETVNNRRKKFQVCIIIHVLGLYFRRLKAR